MKPTVRTLLERGDLALTPLVGEPDLPAGALDAPVPWVHSSDLEDPAPFLEPGQVLLTTGTQFGADTGHDDPAVFDAYVARLAGAGLAALGFGSEVVRAGTPVALVEACRRNGLPLFEVPYRVPFIRIARTIADLNAADANARQAWALQAFSTASSSMLLTITEN